MKTVALSTAILALGLTSAFAAPISGQNRNGVILSMTESQIPGQQGRAIRQISEQFQTVKNSNPLFVGNSVEVAQQEVNGDKVAHHGFGETRNNQGDTYIWTANGTMQLQNGVPTEAAGRWEIVSGTGKLQNAKGSGQYNCKFGPNTINGCDWSGDIEGAPSM
jgi:hypothetical protein